MQKKEYFLEIGGKKLTAQFNDLADQANGSVLLYYGNTAVLVTAVMSGKEKDADFFPLTVDYEEKFYAAGQILGNKFARREGKPSDEAVLSGRVADRTIRPLFDQRIRNEIQVVITVLALDQYDPDVFGVIGSSLALATSYIPFNGPVSSVRVLKNKNSQEFIINPSYTERQNPDAELDLLVCGKDGKVNMIEVGSKQVDESLLIKGLERAAEEIEKIQQFQKTIVSETGKQKLSLSLANTPKEVEDLFAEFIAPKLLENVFNPNGKETTEQIQKEWQSLTAEKLIPEHLKFVGALFEHKLDELLHDEAINNNRRPDGRSFDEIRPLFAQAGGISEIHHGTGVFYRGGTHVLSVLTLGGPKEAQVMDGIETQPDKRFIHQYNFPPFSTGETGRMGGTNRRMVGHGALAEKALLPVIPTKETFPYTIRIVSEALASNGSTSMASVCGSSLALMDGGVQILTPVAGIASGLMMRDENNYKVLTDIQGPEDHHGDMDFKVAGTKNGVTAVQMDVKIEGVSIKILTEAFEKARLARLKILGVIESALSAPRGELKPNTPKIICLTIKKDQIGLVIGGGGKTINAIKEKTGVEIDIEDDGTVYITGKTPGAEQARDIIAEMTKEYKIGDRALGEVVRVVEFGAFVNIGGTTEGLVHISEVAPFRINQVSSYLKEGMKVPVIVKGVDDRGKISLSIKSAEPNFFKPVEQPQTNNNQNGRTDEHRT